MLEFSTDHLQEVSGGANKEYILEKDLKKAGFGAPVKCTHIVASSEYIQGNQGKNWVGNR